MQKEVEVITMRRSKIGMLFVVSILAMAGIGISYAGLFDQIIVNGYVRAATVDLEVWDYSGTYVWKVWGPNHPEDEIVISTDPDYDPCAEDYPNCQCEEVAFAEGRPWVEGEDDPKQDGTGYDAVIEFSKLFPCIDFHADINFHYTGTIPAKITEVDIIWDGDQDITIDGVTMDWLTYLELLYDQTGGVYGLHYELVPNTADSFPQLHYCDHIKLNVFIHLPQNNIFQGLTGEGYVHIHVLQWNDECDVPPLYPEKGPLLPEDITCTATFTNHPWQYETGRYAYFKTIISGLWPQGTTNPDGDEYNVWDGNWVGWCVDNTGPGNTVSLNVPYTVWMYDSYDRPSVLPGGYDATDIHCDWLDNNNWPYVNWIINHKPAAHTWADVQDAIWYFVDGGIMPPMGSVAYDLVQDALNNPEGLLYHPDAGELIAVILWIDPNLPYPNNPSTLQGWHQVTIIEVDP